jgi:uncharacterized protein
MADTQRPVVDPDLLEILACPESRQPLALADGALLARVNGAIRAGAMKNVGGAAVSAEIEHGLVRQDRRILYPIRERIPVLLVDEGLPVPSA